LNFVLQIFNCIFISSHYLHIYLCKGGRGIYNTHFLRITCCQNMGEEVTVREEEEWLYGGDENGDTATPTLSQAGKNAEEGGGGDSEEGAAAAVAKVLQPDEEAKDEQEKDKEPMVS
jgi:hypothetical protein